MEPYRDRTAKMLRTLYCNYKTAMSIFMSVSDVSYMLIIPGMSYSANSAFLGCIHIVYASSLVALEIQLLSTLALIYTTS